MPIWRRTSPTSWANTSSTHQGFAPERLEAVTRPSAPTRASVGATQGCSKPKVSAPAPRGTARRRAPTPTAQTERPTGGSPTWSERQPKGRWAAGSTEAPPARSPRPSTPRREWVRLRGTRSRGLQSRGRRFSCQPRKARKGGARPPSRGESGYRRNFQRRPCVHHPDPAQSLRLRPTGSAAHAQNVAARILLSLPLDSTL